MSTPIEDKNFMASFLFIFKDFASSPSPIREFWYASIKKDVLSPSVMILSSNDMVMPIGLFLFVIIVYSLFSSHFVIN